MYGTNLYIVPPILRALIHVQTGSSIGDVAVYTFISL